MWIPQTWKLIMVHREFFAFRRERLEHPRAWPGWGSPLLCCIVSCERAFPRASGLAFIRRFAMTLLKNQKENPRWQQLGWLCWVLDQELSIFLLFSISHFSLREESACTLGYTHAWPTGEMRTRSNVLGLICASFTYPSENTFSPRISNIKRY